MKAVDPESTEAAIAHVRSYLDGRIDMEEFWQPIPRITDFYKDYPNEQDNRLGYFWRLVAVQAMAITRLGHFDGEPEFRLYLQRWLDALHRSEDEWQDIVRRNGRPLEHSVPNWDK